jgi:hypothetical protein
MKNLFWHENKYIVNAKEIIRFIFTTSFRIILPIVIATIIFNSIIQTHKLTIENNIILHELKASQPHVK